MEEARLIKGDCLEWLRELPHARLLLTDIPYEEVSRNDSGLRNLDKGKADIATFDLKTFLNEIDGIADIYIIFCGNEQYSEIYSYFAEKQKQHKGTVRQIIWAKTNPSVMNGEYVYLSGTENAVWYKNSGTGKLNCKCKKNWFCHPAGSSKFHPTEKNHKLLTELILDNTNEGDLVIDCCMGSGSTGIVCVETGRDFIGIDIDEKYFEIAQTRIREAEEERDSQLCLSAFIV